MTCLNRNKRLRECIAGWHAFAACHVLDRRHRACGPRKHGTPNSAFKSLRLYLASMVALLLSSDFAAAGDWPQWLGPNRDGGSTEQITPWKSPPKVLWHLPVGEGHSSPVVAGGRVYLHAKVKDKDEEEVLAFDANTGKDIWRVSYERGTFSNPFGVGPRATPVVADGRIYTYGVTGYLSCFETEKGKRLWQVEALKEFQASNLLFGASCSPIVIGKNVQVNVGAKGASVVAFDTNTGAIKWKSQDDSASYSSPIRIERWRKPRKWTGMTGARRCRYRPAAWAPIG